MYLLVEERLYLQENRIGMGHPLSPCIANLYIFFTYDISMVNMPGVILYQHFLDDIVLLAKTTMPLPVHPALEITYMTGSSIFFLDLQLWISCSGRVAYTLYQKLTNWYINIPHSLAHPPHVFHAWVTHEFVRIFWSNSYRDLAFCHIRRIAQHLTDRGYPWPLIQ